MTAKGDLSVTALYTSAVWSWGKLSYAHLFATPDAKRVFDATNAALDAVRLFRRDLPVLRASLLQRHHAIDRLVALSGTKQVLELAAGLSRRGAACTEDPTVRYTEIDLPHVIAKKQSLLDRTPEGRAVLARPGLRLVAGDVETEALETWVFPEPLLVIAEGLMMYLDPAAQRRLFERVRALSARTGEVRLLFDLVPPAEEPRPGRIGQALEAAMKLFTGGRSFEKGTRTRMDIEGDLRAAGFERGGAVDISMYARRFGLPDVEGKTQVVLFDATWATP